MKINILKLCVMFSFVLLSSKVYSFENGAILNLRADFGGSYSMPSISAADLEKLGSSYMKGMVDFVMSGEAEIGYIFGAEEFFNQKDNKVFGGVGLFGVIGVGQGYAGQSSGTLVDIGEEKKQIDVYVNVYYTPVITFGIATKVYFFRNKMAVGLTLGGKMIADPNPTYQFYSSDKDVFDTEVGTLIVTEEMMKKMNPIMGSAKISIEYNIVVLDTLEFILGGYGRYNIYSPQYLTMPKTLMDAAVANSGGKLDFNEPMKSYFINSLDFGLSLGMGLRL